MHSGFTRRHILHTNLYDGKALLKNETQDLKEIIYNKSKNKFEKTMCELILAK